MDKKGFWKGLANAMNWMGVIMNEEETNCKIVEYCINLAIIMDLYKRKLLTENEFEILKKKLEKQAV